MIQRFRKQAQQKEKMRKDLSDDEMVPVETAAAFLGMSVPFVKKWTGKRIPYYKIGTSSRYKIADLKEFLEGCRIENETN